MAFNYASKSSQPVHQYSSRRQPPPLHRVPTYLSARGLEELREFTDDPSSYPDFRREYAAQRDAADLAFFAYNASLDSGPDEMDMFHQALIEFRRNTKDLTERSKIIMRLKRSVQDQVRHSTKRQPVSHVLTETQSALLDQITGGTTLVVHLPGAAGPNTPASPEYIKAYSYFPGTILKEVTAEGDPERIDDIVQTIIRELGVPTMKRFERAFKKAWTTLPGVKLPSSSRPRPLPQIQGLPHPVPSRSCRYLFYGREAPVGAFTAFRHIEHIMRQQDEEDGNYAPVALLGEPSIWTLQDDEVARNRQTGRYL